MINSYVTIYVKTIIKIYTTYHVRDVRCIHWFTSWFQKKSLNTW